MGGSRKSRGHNWQQQAPRPSDHGAGHGKNEQDPPTASLAFNKVLQEVEGGFQVTWKEIFLLLVAIGCLALVSVFVGIAAGMTISIHYYENQSPSVRRMDPRDTSFLYSGPAAYQKVTTLDPHIASNNVIKRNRSGLDLGKVITTTASGQLSMLMVVEETAPLHLESNGEGNGMSQETESPTTDSNRSAMPPEVARALIPNYDEWIERQPDIHIREPKILPTLCSDGETLGFDDWNTLRDAVQEANSISAERFMKWSAYFARAGSSFTGFEDDGLYYEEDIVFTICPGSTLRSRRGTIFINAENLVVECEGCTVDVGGTHLAFGPHAKNVLVRGISFRGARTSSLTFFHDGAEASFEDCNWIGNAGINGKFGAVADVNSTSVVNFYRCEIGQGPRGFGGVAPGSTSSLSIRV